MSLFIKLVGLAASAVLAYAAYRHDLIHTLTEFCTGPGGYSRVFAVLILALNWKTLPFSWTVRVWYSMILHLVVRPFQNHKPDRLFDSVICRSHAALGEVDFYLHKSNSSYLADVDVARSHFFSHLFARSAHLAQRNTVTRFIMDPSKPAKPASGSFAVNLGAVSCSWKKEIKPYQKYEMWTHIAAWDRKWMYVVTHFVEPGASGSRSHGTAPSNSGGNGPPSRKVFATAVSMCVFKIGRLTIHPATMLQGSGLLPERPGGWTNDDADSDVVLDGMEDDAGTWQWVERKRRQGLESTNHLVSLNNLHSQLDGGERAVLGIF